MNDLPNHIARHYVLYHHGEGGPLDRYFDVHWRWVGNLGVDLPVMALMHVMSAAAATRLVVAFVAPLMVAAILLLSRAAHGRVSASAMVALPLVYNVAWLYGFANYSLGVALGLLALAAYLARPPEGWRGALLSALGALAVWTAHMGGWSILVVAAGCAELAGLRRPRDIVDAARRLLPLAAPLVPLLAWRGGATPGPAFEFIEHDVLWAKTVAFLWMLKGVDKGFDLATTGAVLALGLVAILWAGGRRCERRLLGAGIGVCLLCLVTPMRVMGSWGADFRIAPFGVLLLLLSISPAANPRRERLLAAVGVLLFAIRTTVIAATWHRASAVFEQRLRILDDVPYGSRLGFVFVHHGCRWRWSLLPERKLAAYAVVRRAAFVNIMFKVEGTDLMTIRDPRDRRWFDISGEVLPRCPANTLDTPTLAGRLDAMARARFATIWTTGVSAAQLPVPAGYRIARAAGDDVLLRRIGG